MTVLLLVLVPLAVFLGSCSSDNPAGTSTDSLQPDRLQPSDTLTAAQPDSVPTTPDDIAANPDTTSAPQWVAGYAYQQPDGNRLVAGSGSLPAPALDIPLSGAPQWVVAAPIPGGSAWAVVLSSGRVQAFEVVENRAERLAIVPTTLPLGAPPVLLVDQRGQASLAAVPDASVYSSPTLLNAGGRLAYIDDGGDLVVRDGDSASRLSLNALLDARILVDEDERLLLLTDPTERYGHAVLGDGVEAAGMALVETIPEPHIALHIAIAAPSVVEGLAPIWTDLSGDGAREIVVTLSNEEQGAWIAVFDETGDLLATGPAIGQGFRWRHQLAAAPFGIGGEVEIVDVLTPHIGGPVEFFRRVGDALDIVARVSGYTSHLIGSRNLDMAAAGDFDGDGQVELLLPDRTFTRLGAVRRTADGARIAWTLAAGGEIRTNLAAATLDDGRIALGLGTDRTLRLWLP